MPATRRTLMASAIALATPRLALAQAEDWPRRPIRMIVPYAPGGGADLTTRILCEAIRPMLGQPIIVENRAGTNGVVGSEAVARSAPDGYTLVTVTNGHLANRYVMQSLPFDPLRDFTPIAMISNYPMMLAAGAAAPFGDLKGLLDYARAHPRDVSYGTSTAVSSFVGQSFARLSGVEMTEIPYRGGGPMMTDLIAGVLQVGWGSPETVLAQMSSGRLRILGISSTTRMQAAPEVPTIQEVGPKGFDHTAWIGFFGPAKLPPEIPARIAAALQQAVQNPATRQRLQEMGNLGIIEGPDAFRERNIREDQAWDKAAREGLLTRITG
jgi:tripartite-type tricarboxylate transporter receptor subunit TctC